MCWLGLNKNYFHGQIFFFLFKNISYIFNILFYFNTYLFGCAALGLVVARELLAVVCGI